MPKHYSPSITLDAQRLFNFKQADTIPPQVGEIFVPVINVGPVVNIVKSAACVNATVQTAWTTPTDKDFYLTAVHLTMVKDATATSTYSRILATINGNAYSILYIPGFTLTAQSQIMVANFNPPIKIDKGTDLQLQNATTVGNVTSEGLFFGFTRESGSQV
jgi:hypothetical protein